MSVFLRIDINLVAFLILSIIFIMARKRLDDSDPFNYAYLKIVPIILSQLLLEALSCIINHKDEDYLIVLSYLIHISLYIVGTVLGYKGYLLIRNLVMPGQVLTKNIRILFRLPLIINIVLTGLSPIFHFAFYLTKENVYYRGNFYFITVITTYFYLICILILIVKNKARLSEYEFSLLVTFGLLPMIGGIVQAIFYGSLLMWSSTAFALVVMYSYLQQRMVHLDYLTGVWSRGSFEFYIKKRLSDHDSNRLGIIYCDIDRLKEINDEHGHLEGDSAIKTATRIFKNSIRKTDIIVRMGGDEFIIVLESVTTEILDATLKRINQAFEEYNQSSQKKYELSCSFGSDILNSDFETIEQFIHHVDTLMYENKKSKKEN